MWRAGAKAAVRARPTRHGDAFLTTRRKALVAAQVRRPRRWAPARQRSRRGLPGPRGGPCPRPGQAPAGWRTFALTQSTIAVVVAPGVKISATP